MNASERGESQAHKSAALFALCRPLLALALQASETDNMRWRRRQRWRIIRTGNLMAAALCLAQQAHKRTQSARDTSLDSSQLQQQQSGAAAAAAAVVARFELSLAATIVSCIS